MKKVKILTDSSIQITPEEVERYQITIVPLNVEVGGKQYIDGETISREEFVEQMLHSDQVPKTSQPPLGRFVEAYDRLGQDGSPILAIIMTKSLSGTIDAAQQAAKMSQADVTVFDSEYTDSALGFQVIKAAEMAADGATIEQIIPELEKIRDHTTLYVAIPTLENIVKGGRLGKMAATLTTLLNINVVVQLKNYKLSVIKKGRGYKTIQHFVDEVMDEVLHDSQRLKGIGFSYVNDATMPKKLAQLVHEKVPKLQILTRVTSPVISTHTGKGAFAIIYYY